MQTVLGDGTHGQNLGADTRSVFDRLRKTEPIAMHGQPAVVWARAQNDAIWDLEGKRYIDFSSGVLVANCGHSHAKILEAIRRQLDQELIYSYLFATREKADFLEALTACAFRSGDQALLFSSGAEAIEASLKLACESARLSGPSNKRVIVSFRGSFHGRTMGAQAAGGQEAQKLWLGSDRPANFCQFAYPAEESLAANFAHFERELSSLGLEGADVAAVLLEPYLGGTVDFAAAAFTKALRSWCDRHHVILIADEVQSGFGRTGRWWGFEHLGVIPDMIVCGKGLSSSLPISAVIGAPRLLGLFSPGSMSTTHSGNTLACAAATACLGVLREEDLVARAASLGLIVRETLVPLETSSPVVGRIRGRGLVFGIHLIDAGGKPDAVFARQVVDQCVERGLMLFSPVGEAGATIKICPPLSIGEEALSAGLSIVCEVLRNASPGATPRAAHV